MKKFASFYLLILLSGCTASNIIALQGIEINDYNGTRLDSLNDFRENSIKGPQTIDINEYELMIFGLVNNSYNYSYSEVLNNQAYQKLVQINCVEGWSVSLLWEGILVKDLINPLGIKNETNTVIFYASDGYSTSFPLDYILNNNILLAYKMNNVTLPTQRGYPFQLVAEDKWGYKWIKWVTSIELSDDNNYKGYWEIRGYNNIGNLNDSKYE